ncbi:MAG: uracil-DNA glycosylase [Sulfitobacter sp.]
MNEVLRFVEQLSKVALPNVFNPYRDICPVHDCSDAPKIRKENLELLLRSAQNLSVKTIWVARDLGYRGGRRTGLALTDEFHLAKKASMFGDIDLKRTTVGPMIKERTASTIWNMVERIGEPIFMWNAFPLHPHLPNDPMSNRCHKASERKHTSWVLNNIIDLLKPEKVYSIGGDEQPHLSGPN